jgi:nitrate reductase delta subunit
LNRTLLYICSRLLTYPNSALLLSLEQLRSQAESLPEREALLKFMDYLDSTELIELQERYVQTFDFSEERNLYLSYTLLGFSMDRGKELLRLKELYKRSGIQDSGKELPDYLPTFLRFLSVADDDEYEELVSRYKMPIINLAKNIEKTGSPYSLLLNAVVHAIGGQV